MKGERQRELNEQKLTICIVCDHSDKNIFGGFYPRSRKIFGCESRYSLFLTFPILTRLLLLQEKNYKYFYFSFPSLAF